MKTQHGIVVTACVTLACGGIETTGRDASTADAATIDVGMANDVAVVDAGLDADMEAGPCAMNVVQVSAGASHTCARRSDGTLWCWGLDEGALGDGMMQSVPAFTQVTALGNAVMSVAAGDNFTCAIKLDGTLWCWGGNYAGQVGDGTSIERLAPVQVVALGSNTTGVSTGALNACATKADGTLWCWGPAVGTGSPGILTPFEVTSVGTNVTTISVGF